MQSDTQTRSTPIWMVLIGWIIGILPVLGLAMSAFMKFNMEPEVMKGFGHLGWDESLALGLGVLEIACVVIYLIPRTAVLGAILLTGYFGGAAATHVRIGESALFPIIFGMLIWLGLVFRIAEVRALLPLRSDLGRASWFKKILIAFGFLVGAFAIVAVVVALQPADYKITRSVTINAPPAQVFAQVNDFHNWQAWSPWEKLDLAFKKTYEGPSAGAGAIYKWAGNDKVGEGSMTLKESQPNDLIRIKLQFDKPFEMAADTEFTFKAEGNQTVVTWTMSGRNNFQFKAFHLVMNTDKMLGGQFEEGLSNLKAVVEGTSKK